MIKMLLNWRIDALFTIFALSLTLLLGETDSVITFIIIKLLSIVGFMNFGMLYKRWDEKGMINDLSDLANEE